MALDLDTLGLSATVTASGISAPDYQTILTSITSYFQQIYGTDATAAQESFARVVGDIFDESVDALLESRTIRTWLKQVRSRLLSLARLFWHRLF
nr:hypothetical protein [Pantoea rwandensis]